MDAPGRQDGIRPPASLAAIAGEHPGLIALRVAPWIVFGPITGLLCERAFRSLRNGHPGLAALYLVLNVSILLAIPAFTAWLAANGIRAAD